VRQGTVRSVRETRRVLLIYTGVDLAFLAYDLLRGVPSPGLVVLARLAIAATLLLAIQVVTAVRAGLVFPALRVVVGGLTMGAYAGVCFATGGSAGAYFAVLPAFPMLYVLAFPDDPQGPVLPVAASVAWGLLLLYADGAPAPLRLQWLTVALFLGGAAIHGAFLLRRAHAEEIAHERARVQAAEALARSEKLRARAERLATLGELAAGVAHEINNPLTYVNANVEALIADCDGKGALRPEVRREMLSDSAEGIARIARIVQDLRSFSRERPSRLEPCRPDEIVDEALRLTSVRLREVGRLERLLPADLPAVLVDRGRVLQALVNLLVNAAEATATNGAPRAARWVRIEARPAPAFLQLAVQDSGPGIRPEARDHLFEPFYTTKANGTGLGLALSRECVETSGGRLELDAASGAGARFVVSLPLAPSDAPARAAASGATPSGSTAARS
jgi:two-component system NtrC family sensor kinase